jgi:hypothetical protein
MLLMIFSLLFSYLTLVITMIFKLHDNSKLLFSHKDYNFSDDILFKLLKLVEYVEKYS